MNITPRFWWPFPEQYSGSINWQGRKQIKANDAGKSLVLLGILLGSLGIGLSLIEERQTFGAFGYYYPITLHPYLFIGATLIGIGINWFIGGLILRSANRDIANDGILLAFLFGAFGVFIWLMISHPDNRLLSPPTPIEEVHKHCPNCNLSVPFSSTQYCPHCGQKLNATKPTYTITEVGLQETR